MLQIWTTSEIKTFLSSCIFYFSAFLSNSCILVCMSSASFLSCFRLFAIFHWSSECNFHWFLLLIEIWSSFISIHPITHTAFHCIFYVVLKIEKYLVYASLCYFEVISLSAVCLGSLGDYPSFHKLEWIYIKEKGPSDFRRES